MFQTNRISKMESLIYYSNIINEKRQEKQKKRDAFIAVATKDIIKDVAEIEKSQACTQSNPRPHSRNTPKSPPLPKLPRLPYSVQLAQQTNIGHKLKIDANNKYLFVEECLQKQI